MSNTQIPMIHPAESLLLSKLPEVVRERAKSIRLLALDVDGILTDGSLWYNEKGEALKRFNALDGHGMKMLQQSGIEIVLITGRSGEFTRRRAGELGIAHFYENTRDKVRVLEEVMGNLGLTFEKVAYMGDDLLDLPVLQKSALAVTVPNAPSYIQQACHFVTSRLGGQGAVRECTDIILAAQGKFSPYLQTKMVSGVVIQ